MRSTAWKAVPPACLHLLALALAVLLVAGISLVPARGLAQDSVLPVELDENAPWLIEADRLVGLHDADIVEAEGNVVLRQGANYLQADFARYYRDTQWVYLRGNVKAGLGGDEIEAEEAEFDLANQVGWLTNGRIFLVEPHLYFTGETIRKELGETYSFDNAYVTACDACPAAWSFSADHGDVTVDGYAHLEGARFNILGQPVAYSPYMFIPAKTTRQSGLLVPDLGYSRNLGFYVNLPVYIVIDDEQDITLYEHGMSDRGFMQGLEYRNYLDLGTKTLVRFDWLYDQEIAREERQENSPLNRDGLVRANHNRYWLRGMMDAELPWDFELRADVDLVSDQNYLREFYSGLSGFSQSRQEFLDEFSRAIADSDQNRTSELLVTRDFERFAVSGSVEWNQSVEHGHGNEAYSRDPSLQRLPELSAYWFKDRIPGLEGFPLEFEADTTYTYFWRRFGTTGNRFDIAPSLSLPLVSGYGSVIPSVTWRHTFWDVDEYEFSSVSEGENEAVSRHLPMVNVTAFTELYNIYDTTGGDDFPLSLDTVGEYRTAALKHSIQPRLEYNGVPNVEQGEFPFFDSEDRINERQELTYSLTNVVTSRQESVVLAANSDGSAEPALEVNYEDVVRFRLEQSYDFNEATRDASPQYDRRPFSDIMAEISLHYLDYVSLTSRTWYSPYLGRITEHENILRAEYPDLIGAQLGFDYQDDLDEYKRTRQEISVLRAQADLTLVEGLSLDLEYDYDLTNDQELMRGMTVNFQHQCFDVSFSYSRTGLDERYEAWVNLVGFNLF